MALEKRGVSVTNIWYFKARNDEEFLEVFSASFRKNTNAQKDLLERLSDAFIEQREQILAIQALSVSLWKTVEVDYGGDIFLEDL